MDWLIILASGVATGTVLLYATVGEMCNALKKVYGEYHERRTA